MTAPAPARAAAGLPAEPYRPLRGREVASVALASVAAALLLRSLLGSGPLLTAVLAVVVFTVVVNLVSRRVEGRRRAADRTVTVVVSSMFAGAMLPLVSLLYTVVSNGTARLDPAFFTMTMRNVVGEGGGAHHAILGTLIITGLAAVISVPIGMLTAVYLVEYGRGRLARAVTFLVDVMTGIPSVVAGLFAYALFVVLFGTGVRFGIGGAVALSVLMVPVVVRAAEEMLKLVPAELREASYALGVPKWRTILKVVLPAAAAGIATGITLAVARVIGETAPLLLIVGSATSLNLDPFHGRMATLPVFTFYSFFQPGARPQPSIDRAWTAALVLMLIVLALNLVARLVARLVRAEGLALAGVPAVQHVHGVPGEAQPLVRPDRRHVALVDVEQHLAEAAVAQRVQAHERQRRAEPASLLRRVDPDDVHLADRRVVVVLVLRVVVRTSWSCGSSTPCPPCTLVQWKPTSRPSRSARKKPAGSNHGSRSRSSTSVTPQPPWSGWAAKARLFSAVHACSSWPTTNVRSATPSGSDGSGSGSVRARRICSSTRLRAKPSEPASTAAAGLSPCAHSRMRPSGDCSTSASTRERPSRLPRDDGATTSSALEPSTSSVTSRWA